MIFLSFLITLHKFITDNTDRFNFSKSYHNWFSKDLPFHDNEQEPNDPSTHFYKKKPFLDKFNTMKLMDLAVVKLRVQLRKRQKSFLGRDYTNAESYFSFIKLLVACKQCASFIYCFPLTAFTLQDFVRKKGRLTL